MKDIDKGLAAIVAVDAHPDIPVGVVIETSGRVYCTLDLAINRPVMRQLVWVERFLVPRRAGVDGASSPGARLRRLLQARAITIIEINRPDHTRNRSHGKKAPTDAESAPARCWPEKPKDFRRPKHCLDVPKFGFISLFQGQSRLPHRAPHLTAW